MRETLVLVPGLLCDAAVWAHQAAGLGERYDLRVADLTGCDTIDAMASAVLEGAAGDFSLAGHSMGARVALQVAARAPERVRRLALLDTGVHPVADGETDARQVLLDVSANLGMGALADRWLPPMVRDGALESDADLRAALRAMVGRMSPDIHRRQIAALLGRPDPRALLPTIRCPVLIGVGEHDRWSPPAQHEPIARAIPHARFVVFPDAGHMAPMENGQAVTDALLAWMAEPA